MFIISDFHINRLTELSAAYKVAVQYYMGRIDSLSLIKCHFVEQEWLIYICKDQWQPAVGIKIASSDINS